MSDIKAILDTQKQSISETYIYKLINKEGFARLPRRSKSTKADTLSQTKVPAPKMIYGVWTGGSGFFAGLNVLPKWFSSYSHRITRKMNMSFLKELCQLWQRLDFWQTQRIWIL